MSAVSITAEAAYVNLWTLRGASQTPLGARELTTPLSPLYRRFGAVKTDEGVQG